MDKVKIRHGVFETNSSSSHSLSVERISPIQLAVTDGNFKPKHNFDIVDGKVCLSGSYEFGWEIEDYDDPNTKAEYCLLDQCTKPGKYRDMLSEVIRLATGLEVSYPDEITGYIDHQSVGTTSELFQNPKDTTALFDFIFNPRSILHTDNDNH